MNEVGIADLLSAGQMRLFPNPNNGSFTVIFDQFGEAALLRIFDATGRIVTEKNFAPAGITTETISLENMPAGIYLARLTTVAGEVVTRMSVVK